MSETSPFIMIARSSLGRCKTELEFGGLAKDVAVTDSSICTIYYKQTAFVWHNDWHCVFGKLDRRARALCSPTPTSQLQVSTRRLSAESQRLEANCGWNTRFLGNFGHISHHHGPLSCGHMACSCWATSSTNGLPALDSFRYISPSFLSVTMLSIPWC